MQNGIYPELKCKPDMEMCLKRIYAWFEQDIIDRVPVRFSVHNSFIKGSETAKSFSNYKERWFDHEYQVVNYKNSIEGISLKGETFPVFFCNLGPNIYSAYFGEELFYDDVTAWTGHSVKSWDDLEKLKFSYDNLYFKKTEELMHTALQMCGSDFLVGYTDLHGGMDCVAGWRNPEDLCIDLYDYENEVKKAVSLADSRFLEVFDRFDDTLKHNGQLSITWMGIPSFQKLHIPSCDFSSMISPSQFEEFCLPSIKMEIAHMDQNVFHLDGEGVARHLDMILELPEITAIQWVPSPNHPNGVFAYMDLYKKIQSAGKSLVLDIEPRELDEFMQNMSPQGLYLCMNVTDGEQQDRILDKLEKW